MQETATRAQERRRETASKLTTLCRQLTADRGLNGFTIEEVCSEVGISRRTFFNYFPTKEDAVFGVDEARDLRRFPEEFVALGSRGWPAVVDDLIGFAVRFATARGESPTDHLKFMTILEHEPRLLARFIGLGREREAALVQMVARRESVSPDDPRARAAVDIVSTVMRSTADRLSDPRVATDFGAAVNESLAALRAVITPRA